MITKGGVGCAVSGIAMLGLMAFVALFLTSCTKEYSYECFACVTTTQQFINGQLVNTQLQPVPCGQVPKDTLYFINSSIWVISKTTCR